MVVGINEPSSANAMADLIMINEIKSMDFPGIKTPEKKFRFIIDEGLLDRARVDEARRDPRCPGTLKSIMGAQVPDSPSVNASNRNQLIIEMQQRLSRTISWLFRMLFCFLQPPHTS